MKNGQSTGTTVCLKLGEYRHSVSEAREAQIVLSLFCFLQHQNAFAVSRPPLMAHGTGLLRTDQGHRFVDAGTYPSTSQQMRCTISLASLGLSGRYECKSSCLRLSPLLVTIFVCLRALRVVLPFFRGWLAWSVFGIRLLNRGRTCTRVICSFQ